MKKNGALEIGTNKIIVAILVLIVVGASFAFVYRADINKWIKMLPDYKYSETDEEVDFTDGDDPLAPPVVLAANYGSEENPVLTTVILNADADDSMYQKVLESIKDKKEFYLSVPEKEKEFWQVNTGRIYLDSKGVWRVMLPLFANPKILEKNDYIFGHNLNLEKALDEIYKIINKSSSGEINVQKS